MIRGFNLLFWFVFALAGLGLAVSLEGSENFNDMSSQQESASDRCEDVRPPRSIAETAYVRNGYRAIRRILAAEKWQEAGDCSCFIDTLTWDEVIAESDRFVTSNNPRIPFNVVELNERADELERNRDEICAGN